jgi:DNA repair protein RecN (Recombination protein N)
MPEVDFSVGFTPLSEPASNGGDSVEFLISANPGSAPRPLAKIASGGEISRIMLAIKTVLAKSDDIDMLIFDEIDTGVSGRAAQKIGMKLKQVSLDRQVVCVTHLAQIASQADRHILIEKKVENSNTFTRLETLDFEGRKRELARIIAGADITEKTLQTASEMLNLAGVHN